MKRSLVIVAVASLAGCTFIDQKVQIAPQMELAQVDIGHGKKVAMKVVDDREDSVIGKRGTGMVQGAKITTDQDIPQLFTDAITDGLRKKGFIPAPFAESESPNLRVDIRSIEYDVSMGLWTGSNMGKASIKVLAKNGNDTYEKVYRGQSEIRTAFVASQETNAKIINGAITEVLRKMFDDRELMDFIAR